MYIELILLAVIMLIAPFFLPITKISKNSINFVAVAMKPKLFIEEWDKSKIKSDLAQKKVVYKFNPTERHLRDKSRKHWFGFAR